MFRVGQKVVCVDGKATAAVGPIWVSDELKETQVYEIAWCGMYTHIQDGTHLCVRLVGLKRVATWRDPTGTMPFRATRFRPLVERKTDISIFTAMLTKTPRELALSEPMGEPK